MLLLLRDITIVQFGCPTLWPKLATGGGWSYWGNKSPTLRMEPDPQARSLFGGGV